VEEGPIKVKKSQGAMWGTGLEVAQATFRPLICGVKNPDGRVFGAGGGVHKGGSHALVVQEGTVRFVDY
jgi:hypothetical protein